MFFSPRVVVFKFKINKEANVRFLPKYTIMIKYDQSLIFTGHLVTKVTIATIVVFFFSNKPIFFEI